MDDNKCGCQTTKNTPSLAPFFANSKHRFGFGEVSIMQKIHEIPYYFFIGRV